MSEVGRLYELFVGGLSSASEIKKKMILIEFADDDRHGVDLKLERVEGGYFVASQLMATVLSVRLLWLEFFGFWGTEGPPLPNTS